MNALKNTVIFLSLFTSSMYASLLSIQPVPDEGIYFASQHIAIDEGDQIFLGLLSFDGNMLWQNEIATVREDAMAVSICSAQEGGILTATASGSGYTDILVTKWNSAGEALNSDTIAFFCYDTPYQLISFEKDYLLLWDSWSDERGLHLALIDSSGNIVNTSFVIPTMHPAPTVLSATENFFIIALSPIVTMEETSLVKFTGFESLVWSQVSQLEYEFNPCYSQDLIIESSGKFVVIWELLEFMGEISKYVISEYSIDGTLDNCYDSSLTDFTEAVYVKLLPNSKMILLEHSSDSSTFQIILADIQGNEELRIPVNYNFIPTKVDYLPDNSFLVIGKATNAGELIRVTDTGEVLWSFQLDD